MQPRSLPVGASGCKSARHEGSLQAAVRASQPQQTSLLRARGSRRARKGPAQDEFGVLRAGEELICPARSWMVTAHPARPAVPRAVRANNAALCMSAQEAFDYNFIHLLRCLYKREGCSCGSPCPAAAWDLASSILLPFFTRGSLAEISARGRKRRLARCVIQACSSSDLG